MLVRHTSAFPQNKRAGGLGARGSWPTPMPGERKRERERRARMARAPAPEDEQCRQ